MVVTIEITDEDEFEKLKQFGTVYGSDTVATTVGVVEGADTANVDDRRVNFVYVG